MPQIVSLPDEKEKRRRTKDATLSRVVVAGVCEILAIELFAALKGRIASRKHPWSGTVGPGSACFLGGMAGRNRSGGIDSETRRPSPR